MKGVIMNNQLKLNFHLPKETLRVNFIPCVDPEKIIIYAEYNGNRLIETLAKDVFDVSKYMENKPNRIPVEHIKNNLRDNILKKTEPNPLSRISYYRAEKIDEIVYNCKNFFEKVKMPKETIIDAIVKGLKAIK